MNVALGWAVKTAIAVGLAITAVACGSGGGGAANGTSSGNASPATAEIGVLLMGNSHTSFNNLPGMVAAMIQAARPGKTVAAVEAPGWMFLDERIADSASLALIRSRRWSAVVLQAQKYSASGLYDYSTAEANDWIKLAREAGAMPVMFPEWPRRGVAETQRIYDLHVSIARKTPACVAPIGQAWDLSVARNPGIVLHAGDGNHAVAAGSFLAALVIAHTITGTSPDDLPVFTQFGIDSDTQSKLRAVATETVQTISPRLYCPDDRPL
ncbi:MAG: hypothetical protein JNN20_12595 [Betaproteobacteria bacterium]|nr:hypothetical protein [Betaproteobacteria bacterium]